MKTLNLTDMELAFLMTMIEQWYGTTIYEDDGADPFCRSIMEELCKKIGAASQSAMIQG